jgi:anti-sigma regulatory factor (Ser/Thr protein kinase)
VVAGARDPPEWTSTQLPHAPTSARAARRFIVAALHGWRLDALVEVAELVAGELVANAVTHTPATTAGIGLLVVLGEDAVRVEVHDGSPDLPEPRGPGDWDKEAGRGLGLVGTQATRWGVHADEHGHGKTVWFEVHR